MGKRKLPLVNEETYYEKFTQLISKSPPLSIAMGTILVMIGCITGAFINMVSEDWAMVKAFVIWGSSGIIIIFAGFFIFKPYWKFRRDYQFLEQEGQKLARKLVEINNRAYSVVTSVDGILAFQLFEVERHTNDKHILITIREIMSHKTQGFDLSKLRNRRLKVPIDLIKWMRNPKSSPPSDYGAFINKMLFDWMYWRSDTDRKFIKYILDWKVGLPKRARAIGVHYVELFDFIDVVNANEFHSGMVDYVYEDDYNGIKEKHGFRKYYTVRVNIDGEEEGIRRCTALIIANSRLSTPEGVRVVMQRILNGGGN